MQIRKNHYDSGIKRKSIQKQHSKTSQTEKTLPQASL
jgi:hypothetical protein